MPTSTREQIDLFERLYTTLPVAVALVDAAGEIARANVRIEELFGYSRVELIGLPVIALVAESSRQELARKLGSCTREPRLFPPGSGLEVLAMRKNGTRFPAQVELSAIRADDFAYTAVLVREISGRKASEDELQKSLDALSIWFECSPDGIALAAGPEHRIFRVNATMEEISGFSREELAGLTIDEILSPETGRQSLEAAHAPLTADRPSNILELSLKTKNRSRVPVEVTYRPIETDRGEVLLAFIRDVTERDRAERALRNREQRLRSIVETVKDYAIFTLDRDGNVADWNPAAERIKGYCAEEIIGKHFSLFYQPEDVKAGKPDRALRTAAAEGRFEDEEWRIRKDGSRFWADVVITALRDETGNLTGFSKIVRDFTSRKQAEEALLLEITKVLLANLDVRKLLSAISASLARIVQHDFAGLAIHDPQSRNLRLLLLKSPAKLNLSSEETVIPVEGTPAGLSFSSRQPLVIDQLDDSRFNTPAIRHLRAAGIQSGCWLPLTSRGRVLGTLSVASSVAGSMANINLNLLTQVAGQVALAIDNTAALDQMTGLMERLQEEKHYLEDELRTEYNFEEILGESPALKHALKQVETVAPTDATVLISGETGTGKEMIARAVHSLSPRTERTFVKLNCAAIPGGLLESELFGHEKGAFTGAIAQKIGRLELANHGTLFLDEVGDIPLDLQPKLLRALQEKEFERLGSTRTISVDVRLIAATNRDLARMVKDGQFRSDLYYRLRVFPIHLAPLRERPGDIPMLVYHFVEKHARRMNRKIDSIPPEVLQALEQWSWPGNIRELENFIERAVILSPGRVLRAPLSELTGANRPEGYPVQLSTLDSAQKEHILRALRETKGVVGGPHGAAARLGLKRTTLNNKMRRLGITRKDI